MSPFNPFVLMHIVRDAMLAVWQKSPRAFQEEVIMKILSMKVSSYQVETAGVLIVQATGGGKSAIAQTSGVICGGSILVIEPILSLGADQMTKIMEASQVQGPVASFHLDEIKSAAEATLVLEAVAKLETGTAFTIFIFASPQALLKKPWDGLLKDILERDVLQLLLVDEVHLFILFGATFRPEFPNLRKVLFDLVKASDMMVDGECVKTILKVPLVLMTATYYNAR